MSSRLFPVSHYAGDDDPKVLSYFSASLKCKRNNDETLIN